MVARSWAASSWTAVSICHLGIGDVSSLGSIFQSGTYSLVTLEAVAVFLIAGGLAGFRCVGASVVEAFRELSLFGVLG